MVHYVDLPQGRVHLGSCKASSRRSGKIPYFNFPSKLSENRRTTPPCTEETRFQDRLLLQESYEAARIRALSLNRGMMSGAPCVGNGEAGAVLGYGRHRIGSYATLARLANSENSSKSIEIQKSPSSFTSVPVGRPVPVSYSSSRRQQRATDLLADNRRVVGGAVVRQRPTVKLFSWDS